MSRFPWVSGFIGLLAAITPPGINMIEGAFFSMETLSQNMLRPIVLAGAAVICTLAILEWHLRCFIHRRHNQAPQVQPQQAQPQQTQGG